MTSWSSGLSDLLQQGTITGFALITSQGVVQPAAGLFEEVCAQGVSSAVQGLIQPFYSACEPPTTHTLDGKQLQVIQQTDSHYVAISKQRESGLIALQQPPGVLLVSFDRSTHPTAVLTAVQTACTTAPAKRQHGVSDTSPAHSRAAFPAPTPS